MVGIDSAKECRLLQLSHYHQHGTEEIEMPRSWNAMVSREVRS